MRRWSVRTLILPVTAVVICVNSQLVQAQEEATIGIACRVVDDIRREPVSRARLTLSGDGLPDPVAVYADTNGACALPKVRSGKYLLTVEKPGFIPWRAGTPMDRPGSVMGPIPIDTRGLAEVNLHEIVLTAVRQISGVVRWRSGDPAERVVVHALSVKAGKASFKVGEVILVATNDRGEFKLEGLQPGRYIPYAYTVGLADTSTKPMVAFPVFYPGSDAPDPAASIDLRNTPDAANINIILSEVAGIPIDGMVLPSTDFPEGTAVMIGLMTPGPAQPFAGTRSQVGKPFHFSAIPPGAFTLVAMATENPNSRIFLPIQVGSRPISDLKISLVPTPPLAGRAEVEEPPQDSKSAAQGELRKVPVPGVTIVTEGSNLSFFGYTGARSDKEGQFHLDGLAAGQQYAASVEVPAGTYLARISQGDRSAEGTPFAITAGGSEIEIVLRRDPGKVEGRVVYPDNIAPGGIVVLAPQRQSAESRFKVVKPRGDGSFTLSDIAPGDYLAFAFDRDEEQAYWDTAYREQYKSGASPISIEPKATLPLTLNVIRSRTAR
jgi:hypothetical protein